MSYKIVNVTPDTPEWEEERRNSIGASEAAAVLGLDPWQTALDVYKSKLGTDRDFDPLLAWLGHKDEPTIAEWIEKFSGLHVRLSQGFMARSVEHPFIHASFDRLIDESGLLIPVQLKTAHEYTSHKWDEGIPTQYRVQVQTEMLVADAPRALLVVRIGARDFRAVWEARDERFIQEHLIPGLSTFWDGVQSGTPPAPQTIAEAQELWPGAERQELELSEEAFEALERRTVLLADIKSMTEEADALKLAMAEYAQDATELTYQGRTVYTWRPQKGRESFDAATFRTEHPDLAAEYTKQGAPFRVLRHVKQKESK